MRSTVKKTQLLGESFGKAVAKLRKSILFEFVVRLKLNICFQCGEEITTVQELSIEHKEPWMSAENPIESFYNLENIAFSHLSCNVRAAKHEKGIRKTTLHGVSKYRCGCRCELCVKATRNYNKELNQTEERKAYNRDYQRKRYATDKNFRNYYLEKGRKKKMPM